MFSFLHLLYTGDFKADGWVLITVETEDLYFYLDATARLERIHFLGLKESSFSVASSVNGQSRKKGNKPWGAMRQGHVGASHSQGIYLLLWRLATSSLQEAARMNSVHHCTGTTFPSYAVIIRESSWAFISLTVRGKWKCSARCPLFSLTGFPRASSCNSQSSFYDH